MKDRKRDATCLSSRGMKRSKEKQPQRRFHLRFSIRQEHSQLQPPKGSLSLSAKGRGGARTGEEGCEGRSPRDEDGWTPGRFVFARELGGDFLGCLYFSDYQRSQ